MSKKSFVVSDETVNRYGYRVLTDGIDTTQFEKNPLMYYLHDRFAHKENKPRVTVIGVWENIRKENGQLLADPVFDMDDDFAAEVARKVEKKFLRMASIGFDPLEVSDAKELIKPGQKRGTVTKSELLEISIVDRGGNNNALMLCNSQGERLNVDEHLPELTLDDKPKPEIHMKEVKEINKALNLDEGATLADTLKAIQTLQDKATTLSALEDEIATTEATEAEELIDKLIENDVLPEALKETQLAALKANFKTEKPKYAKLLSDATDGDDKGETPKSSKELGDFIESKPPMGGKSKEEALAAKDGKKDYKWYQENDQEALLKLQAENPKKFNELLQAHIGEE